MSDPNEQQQQLQRSFLQQQKKIKALKELVQKSVVAHDSSRSATKEKAKSIAERLLKSKAKIKHGSRETSSPEVSFMAKDDANTLSISHETLPLQSTTICLDSASNPMPKCTTLKLEAPLTNEALSSIPYSNHSSEKITLMKQQLEQNKLRMAQKVSSKQHVEQLVSQLKGKQLKDEITQQCLENDAELGRSMSDLSNLKQHTPVRHKSVIDLSGQNFSWERERIKFLENRCLLLEKQVEKEKQNNLRTNNTNVSPNPNKQLETRILELESVLQEKEWQFEAETNSLKAEIKKLQNSREITDFEASEENEKVLTENEQLKKKIEVLKKENLQLKEQLEIFSQQLKDSTTENIDNTTVTLPDKIEELKEQLETFKSKESIESLDTLNENIFLKQENETQLQRIKELSEINDVLETTRFDLTSKCTEFEEQIKQLKADLVLSHENLRLLEEKCTVLEENKNSIMSFPSSSIPTETDSQVKAEMAKQIQELTDEVADMRMENAELKYTINDQSKLEINDNSIAEKIASLEACIEAQREDLLKSNEQQRKYEEEVMEKTIELNVLSANFKVLEEKLELSSKSKPLFSTSISADQDCNNQELVLEIQQLKQKLDESNKAMIKLKLKCKQAEKQIEKLRKSSDLHGEVVKLTKDLEQMQLKITELEDEKGQWQLTLMETSQSSSKNGEAKQNIHQECEEKILVLESILKEKEVQLETQKEGEQSRVTSELGQIHLEEEVKRLTEVLFSLRKDIESKDLKLQELAEELDKVHTQKDELDKKLEHYLHENMELLDKIEKLSKSSSSAESIEIVERLTQQEKQELEDFNNRLGDTNEETPSQKEAVNELTQTEINPEITESLNKLREESSELMNKIELFTTERREVLDKMEFLNSENQGLLRRIEELTNEKKDLEEKLSKQAEDCNDLQIKVNNVTKEKESLTTQMQEFKTQKTQLSQELSSLQQSSEVVAALDSGETLFEKCEKSLSKLYGELEAYRKANDKKSKFIISKKLAKEAENAHSQLSELLQKVKEASSAVETVTVVETVVAVTAPNGKALAEYEQLTAQNRELKATVQELRRTLDEAKDQQDDETDNRFLSDERQLVPSEKYNNENNVKLQESLKQIEEYEVQFSELQSRVENLTQELYEARTGLDEKSTEISELSTELVSLRKLSEDFDRLINDKEMTHEKQIEYLTRLRKQLEAKCDTYEQEIEILQTLVKEQKQQLIEALKEHEHEMNLKLLEIQQQERKVQEMREELSQLKQTSALQGTELTQDLQNECEKLKESLKINKLLVQQQIEELLKKQETIETLNQQIIDLYQSMSDHANKIFEKEDEISYLQDLYENNKKEICKLEQMQKELLKQNQELTLVNKEQKEQINQQLAELSTMKTCKQKVQELEQRNKEQLDKLKKYAANLKKKAQQCLDFESKLKFLESQTQTTSNKNQLDVLNRDNIVLQEKLQKASQQLQDKVEALEEIGNAKISVDNELQLLRQELNKRETELETVRRESMIDIQNLKKLLFETQEQLKLKVYGVEELNQLLSEKDTETNQLRAALHDVQSEMQKLRNNVSSAKSIFILPEAQHTVEQLQFNSESEQLRLELQASKGVIEKLEHELKATQQYYSLASDGAALNEADKLKEELQFTNDNLKLKVKEITELRQSLMAAQEQLTDWGNESSVKNTDLNKVSTEKPEKQVITELENELITLRKRDCESSQKIQELTGLLESLQSNSSKEQSNNDFEIKLKQLSDELKAKSLKFEKSKAVIKERNGQIQKLQTQLKELQEKLAACPEEKPISPTTHHQLDASINEPVRLELEVLQDAYNKLNEKYNSEKANFKETITRLETLHDGIQAKLQEDMAYIETIEQENKTFKDKICRLQECVFSFEERRASMERKVNFMDEQMQTKNEEHLKAEDELIYRLNMLSEHDEVIAQRLIDSQSEKEALEENFRQLQNEYNVLQKQYKKLETEFSTFKISTRDDYEQKIDALTEQLKKSETDMDKQKNLYDNKLAAKVTELDTLECELSDQLEIFNNEKRQLLEQLERVTDDCAAHQNDILRLEENTNTLEQAKNELEREATWLRMQNENIQQDVQELRLQSMQDKTEIENCRHQMETLSSNHESELQALRTQIAELDTLRMQVGQNQTDDQVFIETENKRLTDLLAEKEALIENYQRQNLQLQMATSSTSSNVSHQVDPFTLTFGPSNNQAAGNDNTNDEIERLMQDLQEKNQQIYRLQQELSKVQIELNVATEANQGMQAQLTGRQQDAVTVPTLQSVPSLSESQQLDVIPAPPMFFTADTAIRSPFDDLIQHSHSAEFANEDSLEQPPTIEDLQRNVSDLEKHAQDLEHKLAVRNQRELEYEEKLRDFESRYQEREKQLQQANVDLQKINIELSKFQEQQRELLSKQHELNDFKIQVDYLENLLQSKDEEIKRFKSKEQDNEFIKTNLPLENQIVPAFQDPTIQPTLDMFFGNSAPAPEFEAFTIPQQSKEPVFEELIVPKKTYDCYPQEKDLKTVQENPITSLDLGEDWGDSWGNSEATVEAEHYAKHTNMTSAAFSLVPRDQQLELEIQDLHERLQELQIALDRSEEQKKELHIKSGKLMKKLKEYKSKLDEFQLSTHSKDNRKSSSVESNSMFADLDAAIQEELKSQIIILEARLEEHKKIIDNFNIEREKLLKRIDVLTAGNERMSDMKERQDMDVQMYQARIRELQEKLANLENWGEEDKPLIEESKSNQLENISPNALSDLQKQVSNLTLEVQDITGDRLELQAMLDEERVNLTKAEHTVASLRQQVQILEEHTSTERSAETYQLNNLKLDMQNLRESYSNLLSNKERLDADFKNQTETLTMSQANEKRLKAEVEALQLEIETLRDTLSNTKQSLINLDSELSLLKEQKEKQIDEISCREKRESLDLISQEIKLLLQEKQTLEEHASKLLEENENFKLNQTTENDIKQLEDKLQSLTAENEHLKRTAVDSRSSNTNDDLLASLQEKESEIIHLKQRISDLMDEDQTEKLVLEILTKNQEIHLLKMEVKQLKEEKLELENNLSLQITNEMHANKDDTFNAKDGESRVQQLEAQIKEFLEEKKHMEEELQVLNNHVIESLQLEDKLKVLTLELDTKNVEISELRKTIESFYSTREISKRDDSVDFVALNNRWEEIVEQRCGEIAKMWQDHLAQRERDFQAIEERLKEEVSALKNNQTGNLTIDTRPKIESAESTSSSTAASETTSISQNTSAQASQDVTPLRTRSEDPDSIIEKMQSALESQEMEIVTLKEQLAIRSAEYARLAAQYDPFKLQTTSSHSSLTAFSENRRQTSLEAPMVSKSELDLAMYMLHQRDMRCEEMTLEIVNLLAERDTLQLKLSNTLRQLEAKNAQSEGLAEAFHVTGVLSSSPSKNVSITSDAGLTVSTTAEDDLNEKLSQLQTVSHSKDKIIKEEREQRIRQIEKLQQDVAKMPPAAVSELIGTDLSQTNQSPSNVLLNWLWGSRSGGGASQSGF